MARFILTTHWTGGDAFPFIKFGRFLLQRGHEVCLCAHSEYRDVAEKEGYVFIPWDTPEEYADLQNYMVYLLNPLRNPERYQEFRRKYQSKAKRLEELNKLLPFCDENSVIVGRHRSSIAGMLTAEKAGIPFVPIILAPSYIKYMPFHENMLGAEMRDDINAIRDDLGLEPIDSWIKYLSSPHKSLAFWPDWFSPAQDDWCIQPEFAGFPLGKKPVPTHKVHDMDTELAELDAFIAEHGKPVLIAAGASKTVGAEFFEAAVKGCRAAGYSAVITTRYPELLPESLPENMKWFPFLPFDRVVSKIKILVHHGGIGTVSDAILAGIPQFIYGADCDRPDNADRVGALGIGGYLPVKCWDEASVLEGLKAIDTPECREKCAEYSTLLQAQKAMDHACEVLEDAVGNPNYLLNIKDFGAGYVSQNEQKNTPKEDKKTPSELSPEKRRLLMKLLKKKNDNVCLSQT